MLGGGAGGCDCRFDALDSGRGEDERCTFVEAAGACVDGGAIMYSRAMQDVEEGRGLVGRTFTDSSRSSVPVRLITRLAISIAPTDNGEVHELLLLSSSDIDLNSSYRSTHRSLPIPMNSRLFTLSTALVCLYKSLQHADLSIQYRGSSSSNDG